MSFFDSKETKLYVDQYRFTDTLTSVTVKSGHTLVDSTVIGDGGRRFIPGISEDKLSVEGLFDDGTAGSDVINDALRSATSSLVVTVYPGGEAAANDQNAVGYGSDQLWSPGIEYSSSVGSLVTFSSEMESSSYEALKSFGFQNIASSGNSYRHDGSAASSNGGSWYYHVIGFTASGGNAQWQLTLQDSADGASWATVGSETVNITAKASARRAFSGTLRRYVRVLHTLDATTGTIQYSAGYYRG